MSRTLEDVIADWRGDAAVLRRQGHVKDADLIERVCTDVAHAAEDFLTWVAEPDAVIRSGHSVPWLRARFPAWLEQGLAKQVGPRRMYRLVVLPRRPNLDAARQAGRDAARRIA